MMRLTTHFALMVLFLSGCSVELIKAVSTGTNTDLENCTSDSTKVDVTVASSDLIFVTITTIGDISSTDDSVTSLVQAADSGVCYGKVTYDLGADFLEQNICSGKTIFNKAGTAVCVDGAASNTIASASDVLSGTSGYSASGAAINGTMTNTALWNVQTTAFPGAGKITTYTHSITPADICTGKTLFGVSGTATCNPNGFGDLMASSAFRADFAGATLNAATAARAGATLTEENTYASNFQTSHVLVPDPAAHKNQVVDKKNYLDTIHGDRPNKACGLTGSLSVRIADCVTQNGNMATWEGAKYGMQGEGDWRLVTAYQDGLNAGDTCTYHPGDECFEVWQDQRTGLVWSDLSTRPYNWYQFVGYSSSASTAASITYEAGAGLGTDCSFVEITDVTTVAESSGLDGKAFVIHENGGSVGVWIDVDNSGTAQPAGIGGTGTQIEITGITTGMTANQVAQVIASTLDPYPDWRVETPGANTVRIIDENTGARTDAADQGGGEATNFTITNVAQGAATTTCQPAAPVALCPDATFINSANGLNGSNGLSNYVNPSNDTDFKGNLRWVDPNTSPSSGTLGVIWRAPTKEDFFQGKVNGLREVHRELMDDNTADEDIWTATGYGDNNNNRAYYFWNSSSDGDYFVNQNALMNNEFYGICVGSLQQF